jgi:hypothetical protein
MANNRFGLRTRLGLIRDYPEGLIALDADASAFITITGISNSTIIKAVNDLCNDLKSYAIWDKLKAIYPLVGGSASAHKFNLKDARDLDAAYRLTFYGGITHSDTGIAFNGTTGYADTYLTLTAAGGFNNMHMSFYSRTNPTPNGSAVEIGRGAGTAGSYANLFLKLDVSNTFGGSLGSKDMTGTNSDSRCFGLITATSSTSSKTYKNGSVVTTNTGTQTQTAQSYSVFLGAQGNTTTATNFSQKECAFASIGEGLNDTEVSNLYTAVQAFQTTLGRQV